MPLILDDYGVGADILFVGMNPSFSPKAALRRDLFTWQPTLEGEELARRVDDVIRFEAQARTFYAPYFRPLKQFAAEAGAETHVHIDMFLMRHTTQKDVHEAYGDTFAKLNSFAREQFELFRHTLQAIAPRTVVIANAGASHIALDGLPLTTADRGRTYEWAGMPNVPVFLCGMISGQRALDVFSRARLAADVRAAIEDTACRRTS